jgi:hypothetical protein
MYPKVSEGTIPSVSAHFAPEGDDYDEKYFSKIDISSGLISSHHVNDVFIGFHFTKR